MQIVSDGSYSPEIKVGEAAWVIAYDNRNYITAGIPVTGHCTDRCSHQSKLAGTLGAIIHVDHPCAQHNISPTQARLSCGSQAAVQKANTSLYNLRIKHFDVISAIHNTKAISTQSWTINRAKGHQDNHTLYEDLDMWGKLNVIADSIAKNMLTHIITTNTMDYALYQCPNEIDHVLLGTVANIQNITSRLVYYISHSIAQAFALTYCESKNILHNQDYIRLAG
mmetsp:Transcript_7445/g.10652  ORF Transcript_7445/g.10652 Transcript_7445/m.10652 type:complete len:224 (+) Transcript_7445:368-1039(+)